MSFESMYVQTRGFSSVLRDVTAQLPSLANRHDDIERICDGQWFTVPLFQTLIDEIIVENGNEAGRVTLARALLTEETFDTWARYNNILFLATNPRGEVPAY